MVLAASLTMLVVGPDMGGGAALTGDCDANGVPDDAELPRLDMQIPLRLVVGEDPYAVALADLTGDGVPDIAAAAGGSNAVTVLVNRGGRTFGPGVAYPVATRPLAVQAGDLDGDGDADLAVAAAHAGVVEVLRNRGDGTFNPALALPVTESPRRLRLADLNGDRRLDIVVQAGGAVAFLRNDGAAGFAAAVTITTGPGSGLAVGDLDADGDTDLVLGQAEPPRAWVLRNAGNFVFTPAHIPLEGVPEDSLVDPVALADVDGDADLDVVVSFDAAAVWLANDGSGTLAAPNALTDMGGRIAVGDLDGDGRREVIGIRDDEAVFVTPGPGTEPGRDTRVVAAGTDLFAPAIADLSGDGYPDVVLSAYSGESIWVIYGSERGLAAPEVRPVGARPVAAVPTDLDRDDDLDLAVTHGSPGRVSLLRNTGDGRLREVTVLPLSANASQATVTDLDADGDADVAVVASDGTIRLLRQQEVFAFAEGPRIEQMHGATAIVSADLDGDGDADLAVPRSSEVTVIRQEVGGAYGSRASYTTPVSSRGLAATDFDRDGDIDLLVGSASLTAVLVNDGTGQFALEQVAAVGADLLVVADVDADGDDDLVIAAPRLKGVSLLRNRGRRQVGLPEPIVDTLGTLHVALVDLTDDGALDIVAGLAGESALAVAVNRGNGRFQTARRFEIPAGDGSRISIGDVDGDGTPELVWVAFGTDEVHIVRSEMSGTTAADCDGNDVLDACELVGADCDANGVRDLCERDADDDAVPDGCDTCPGRDDHADTDGDGARDCDEGCPNDPGKTAPAVCGCGLADSDSDADGSVDCRDRCPGVADPDDTDADADGRGDACEQCPLDPNRGRAGPCGCGVPDADADGDGWLDCVDLCPTDALQSAPGICGCGRPEMLLDDADGDRVRDCVDNCPRQPNASQTDADADGRGDACDGTVGPNCPADCDGSGVVTADEVAAVIPLVFDVPAILTCRSVDMDQDARVTAAEVVAAVREGTGCDGSPPPPVPLGPIEYPVRDDRQLEAAGAPAACCGAAGGCVVVWVDAADRIVAQQLDAEGRPRGDAAPVTPEGARGRRPAVACDRDGGFFVTWDGPGAMADADVYGRRFDAVGWSLGAAARINTATRYDQTASAIATDGDGRFAVAWAGFELAGGGIGSVVHLRVYGADGVGSEPRRVQDLDAGGGDTPAVALTADSVVVAWVAIPSGRPTLMVRRLLFDGEPLGARVTVSDEPAAGIGRPSIAVGPHGDFTIVWHRRPPDGGRPEVRVRHYDARGAATTGEVIWSTVPSTTHAWPAIARALDGRGLVVWQTGDSSRFGSADVLARRVGADGGPLGDPFRVNTIVRDDQREPALAFDGRGIGLVVWAGRGPGDHYGIFAKRFDPTGAALPAPTPRPTIPPTPEAEDG